MITRAVCVATVLFLAVCSGAAQQVVPDRTAIQRGDPAQSPYVFAYFKEPGSQGIYLALSHDGYTYTPLNDGQPWLKPEQPGELMRDVFITRKPDGSGFRAVWTWDWKGNAIGTAESSDLIHWGPQHRMDVMRDFRGVRNTWAPETYWDNQRRDWLIIWSSSFNDATAGPQGLRIWSTHTQDFVGFSKPELFFDRGFPAIDATIFHRDMDGHNDFVLVIKDQTPAPLRYDERWAAGPTVDGPWGPLSGPINESWSEGPSVIQVGQKAIVYYDHYRPPRARYEGVETTDWIQWSSVDETMHFPDAAKHGSFFQVSEAEAKRVSARHDAGGAGPAAPAH